MTRPASVIKTYTPDEVSLHKELADVYFSKKSPVSKKKPKKARAAKRWQRLTASLPVVSAALIALSLAVFIGMLTRQDPGALRRAIRGADTVKIVEGGTFNRFITARTEGRAASFEGAALARDRYIMLGAAATGRNFLTIDFRFPADLSGKDVSILARGRHGGEMVSFSVRDSQKRSYRSEPFYIQAKWSRASIPLARYSNVVDIGNIERMKVEYDEGVSSPPDGKTEVGREVYIKDILLTKGQG